MDYDNFLNNFDKLSKIGWTEKNGTNRVSLNKYDLMARNELVAQLRKIKAETRFDDAGNIYGITGRSEGEIITMGSHMDSVPNGGRFDGMYGVVAGFQVIKELSNEGNRKRAAVIDFTNEEGSRWQPDLQGSGLATGVFKKDFAYSREDEEGLSFGEVLKKTSFLGTAENRVKKLRPDRYIELHIEQGPVLEREGFEIGIPLGIATDIVDFYTFIGESNQAGPTPMNVRKDALVSASKFIQFVNETANKVGTQLVMTVGEIRNTPNVYSVIPRKVQLKLDTRSPDRKLAYEYSSIALEKAREIAAGGGFQLRHKRGWTLDTTTFDKDLVATIEKVCKKSNLKYKMIYSWPTHDAMYMNRITSTAMIMIPSHHGRSHTKEEYSSDSDLLRGLKVLKSTVDSLQ